jgi:L-aminoadipate-semialdehyde dehydrogenase
MPTKKHELPSPREEALDICNRLRVPASLLAADGLPARTPITGETITYVRRTTLNEAKRAIGLAQDAFRAWRRMPAPRRGELVRLFSDELRAAKDELGRLVTLETGKILSEGLGEVQEMIDISDFAVGLSRQLYGLTIASERLSHRIMETWHPLGPTGIITSFNFPVAVWSWNAALALVCGNACIWKPSEKTTLTALATQALFDRAAARFGDAPQGLSVLLIGGREMGELLADDVRVPLVSATGSTAMGRAVGERLARRFGRAILELSGNNAAIIAPSADLDLAVQAIAFAGIGTTGQRCTTLRRLFVHDDIYDKLIPHLCKVYSRVAIGDPRDENTLMGPLIDGQAYEAMQRTLDDARTVKACVRGGSRVLEEKYPAGFYVSPALVELDSQADFVKRETFAPIIYCLRYQSLETAITEQNDVPQGLASSIFTQDLREAETFVSAIGSDCGIANVNMGPSGAEIGGAFGGEKETGGGREAGSDAWKNYMRRATNTINYGTALPLAQGVMFTVER